LLAKVIPVENILFASETIGAVQGIDPETGHHFDDTKRYIQQVPWLSDTERARIYEGNARVVYSRLSAQIDRQRAGDTA
jgi:4-oxalmesaconate hydratase